MSALSKHLVVSNGNGTGVINQLVAEGLVARETPPSDRRAFLVRITKAGRQVMDSMTQTNLGRVVHL